MKQVLVKEKKYQGQYVAVKNIRNTRVIASGSNLKTTLEKALKKGVKKPLLIYVPEKDTVHIY